ncbi:hypothetical protein [Reichenbachiella versicolor]|uniref:hypothetical protein n=1 Tax=Reichenbachiella versicolor TaxID=1821036 RepID=UPI000D6DEB0F|nr:hypothetical protein [Reichenbachiella versicolor]
MIPAIFALLSFTLGDGHYKNGFFEHDDPIKIIETHVVEEDWKKEAVELTKAHIKEMHHLKHEGSHLYHNLIKASKSRDTQFIIVDSLIHQIVEIEHKQNDNWIDARYSLSKKMGSDEFYDIMESAKTLDKIKSENEQAANSSKDNRNLYFTTIESAINESIENPTKKDKINIELFKFKSLVMTSLDSLDKVKYFEDPRLDNHHASRKELTYFSNHIIDIDKEVLEEYLDFYKFLAGACSSDEWKHIEKVMHKTFHK